MGPRNEHQEDQGDAPDYNFSKLGHDDDGRGKPKTPQVALSPSLSCGGRTRRGLLSSGETPMASKRRVATAQ